MTAVPINQLARNKAGRWRGVCIDFSLRILVEVHLTHGRPW